MDIGKYKERIENELGVYFNELNLPTSDVAVIGAVENLREFTLRPAKRLRPLLMIAAYKCFRNDDKILRPSLSIELMQSSLLIHDDIIDGDEIRRGGKTIHKIYEDSENENYGISMGINIGDLGAILMFETIDNSNFSIERKFEANKKLRQIYRDEICGQIMDVSNFKGIPSLNKVKEIYLLKTVPYSTIGPLELGCILGGGNFSDFGDYGNLLGIAFQIKDDLLGIFGDTAQTGKSNSSDIKEGKFTYPLVHTLENCDQEFEREIILKSLGKKNMEESELVEVKRIIKETSLDEMNKIISDNIKKAKEGLSSSLKSDGCDVLIQIAGKIGNRDN